LNRFRIVVSGILAAALGIWIWQVESPKLEAEQVGDRLLSFESTLVEKFTLHYPGSDTIEVEKSAEGWQLSQPISYRADQEQIERFVMAAQELVAERRLEGSELADLAEYGLAEDAYTARLTLSLSGGETLPALFMGRTTPVGYSAFARVEGEDNVAVIPLLFHSGIRKTPFEFREKSLFGLRADLISQVELHSAAGSLMLKKSQEGWRLEDPVSDLADQKRVEGLLNSAVSLTALAFFDNENLNREILGLGEDATQFVVRFDETTGIAFRLGTADEINPPGTYFERSLDGQVAKVDSAQAAAFTVGYRQLLDRHLFRCDPAAVTSIKVDRSGAATFTLVRDSSDIWMFADADNEARPAADSDAVTRVLAGFNEMEGTEIVSEGGDDEMVSFGLDKPIVSIELRNSADPNQPPCETVEAGVVVESETKATYYVRRKNSPNILVAPAHVFSRIDVFRQDLEQRDP
jgi:hypothetical protein